MTDNDFQNGIQYHRNDGIKGDYDRLQSEEEVISLLKDGRLDPYEVCPTYESKTFMLRFLSTDDAIDLLKCYNNRDAQRFFNSDNCDYGYWNVYTVDIMKSTINRWIEAYNNKNYIRFGIIDKLIDSVVGTIEMFGGTHGILRIDILPEYECEKYLSEFLEIAEHFYNDFDCERIVSKAIPEATERIKALTKFGYEQYPLSETWNREHYFVKTGNRKKII